MHLYLLEKILYTVLTYYIFVSFTSLMLLFYEIKFKT